MRKNFTAVGFNGTSGLATAYSRHTKALQELADVYVGYYGELQPKSDYGYVHGPAWLVNRAERQVYNIAYLVCETQELSMPYQLAALNCDEIWTCSEFCREALSALQVPVTVVPHYVESTIMQERNSSKPTVLIMFDGNSRLLRKNPVAALQVIKQSGLDVQVIVKASNLRPVFKSWLMKEAKGLDVLWIEEKLDELEMQALYASTDIFLSLHCSEGFGLPILESMSHGKKVIATGWGGNMDYMTNENSYVVDFDIVDCEDSYFLGEWAQVKLDYGVDCLRDAVKSIDDLTKNKAAFTTAQMFSFENTVKATKAAL